MPDEPLAHVSPIGWNHIGFSGDFYANEPLPVQLKGESPPNLCHRL
jgi:hypothetical protein